MAVINEPADLGQLVPDKLRQSSLSLINVGLEPYRLILTDWPTSWMEPEWTEKVVDPGDTLTLAIGTRGVPPLGKFEASMTFEIEGNDKTRMSLPVTGIGLME